MIELRREAIAGAVCLLAALVVPAGGRAAAARAARHATSGDPVRRLDNGQVVLAPALRRALNQRFPGFHHVGDYAPGDFDGDGLEDVGLYLSDRHRGLPLRRSTWLFVAFHQTHAGTFQPYLIARRRDPSTIYDRELRRHQRFGDYSFIVGRGTFTVEDERRRTRQMDFRRSDIMAEVGGADIRIWFFRGGWYHWVWEAGDDFAE